jgi:hypothetical protein
MKILTEPLRVDDLLRFLRSLGYVAERREGGTVEVERGTVTGVVILQLARALVVWNAVNETDARIVAAPASEPLEP